MKVRLCRMDERTLIHLVLAICLIVAGLHGQVLSAVLDVAQIADQVSLDSYMTYLQNDLYAYVGDERAYGPKHDLAQQRIMERFEGFGLTTSLDPFAYSNTRYYNVVGVYPGVTRPREIYIVGAHYDTITGSPGACDNASGVAGVLEAARVLSQYLFESTIVFIAFDREEQFWKGSEAYANHHARDNIRGMITLDMIAYQPYQPAQPQSTYVGLYYHARRTEIVDDLAVHLAAYGGLDCMITKNSGRIGSDYVPFDNVGVPAALLIAYAGPSCPFYHTSSDSLERLTYADYDYGTQITRGVVGYMAAHAGLEPVWVVPDFNGDWKVDIEDLTILIEHWGQDDPAFDIAPPPWGDGVVDRQDLEGLMHYWGQEIPEPGLLARWKLDETEGILAADSAGENDAVLHGEPTWQPESGMIGGALQFDGIDDYTSTEFVLNPANGAFSIFAWIKSDAPGGVIVSQTNGTGSGETWLGTEPSSGKLLSSLVPPPVGRFITQPLKSEFVIIDDQWYHVGFVWDGSYRTLYVDGVEVAKDAMAVAPLKSATGGLYIGAGRTLDASSFFSGLIDDVRIYDRAVTP